MVLSHIVASEVIKWYVESWNQKPLFAKMLPEVTSETSLNTGDYSWARETGDEIMKDYFSRFNVDDASFDLLTWWPLSKGILPNWLRPKSLRVATKEPQPLTLSMLIESAKAGRWLYG